jgi:hypothetical protein
MAFSDPAEKVGRVCGQLYPVELCFPLASEMSLDSSKSRTIALWIGAVCAVPLLCLAVALPWLQSIVLVAILFPALVAYSRFQLEGLIIAFLVCQGLVQLLKRVIFVLGPQPQAVYLGIQLLPACLLLILVVVAFGRFCRVRLPWSGRLLAAFVAVATMATALSARSLPWWVVLSGIHQEILPFTMFFVGVLVMPRHFARIGRTMAVLAGFSVVYGLIQMGGGPTMVDRAWASETFSYSIQGGKVFAYLEGVSPEFRVYSYYADPVTWGFSLLAGLVGAALAREQAKMSRWFWLTLVALVLAGVFCTQTRTVWAGLLVTAGVFVLFRYRAFRRPWLVFCLSMGSFAVVVVGGDFLYRELFLAQRLPLFENALTTRYLTVGTIEARTSAWSALQDAISTRPVIGQGHGAMLYAVRDAEAARLGWKTISHNFLVDLVRNAGVPGALLFVWFYLQWLREGFAVFRGTSDTRLKRSLLWIIAFSVGSVISGYLNGANFMTYEFFLIMGLLTGCATRPRQVDPRREAAFARFGPSAYNAFPPGAVRGRTAV